MGDQFFVSVSGEDGTRFTPWGAAANLRGAGVVVLLVCNAGRTDVEHFSERLIGLHVDLLGGGSRAVVASPWNVDAMSGARWIKHFLEQWSAGQTIADCVYEANAAIANRYEPTDYLAMHLYGDPFVRKAGTY
jgi:CHAT domain-containing protein